MYGVNYILLIPVFMAELIASSFLNQYSILHKSYTYIDTLEEVNYQTHSYCSRGAPTQYKCNKSYFLKLYVYFILQSGPFPVLFVN